VRVQRRRIAVLAVRHAASSHHPAELGVDLAHALGFGLGRRGLALSFGRAPFALDPADVFALEPTVPVSAPVSLDPTRELSQGLARSQVPDEQRPLLRLLFCLRQRREVLRIPFVGLSLCGTLNREPSLGFLRGLLADPVGPALFLECLLGGWTGTHVDGRRRDVARGPPQVGFVLPLGGGHERGEF